MSNFKAKCLRMRGTDKKFCLLLVGFKNYSSCREKADGYLVP